MSGKHWTKAEVARLKAIVEAGQHNVPQAAKILGRHRWGVQLKAYKLGLMWAQKRICPACQERKVQKHHNAKWCAECALQFRKRPRSTLTPEQQQMVRDLAGTMTSRKVAQTIGTSWANVARFARDNKISLDSISYRDDVIEKVCRYYEKHGGVATQKKFPNVKVRSIVKRHKLFSPRQVRWTDEQLVQVARFAGLISADDQARYFNRPRANAGSIKAAWMKRFGRGGSGVNGLSEYVGRHFVTERCPIIRTQFWAQRRFRKGKSTHGSARKLYLWVDIKKHMRADVPEWFRECVTVLAKFQRWLHGTSNVREQVLKLIREVGHEQRNTNEPANTRGNAERRVRRCNRYQKTREHDGPSNGKGLHGRDGAGSGELR
jgi:hypothetical protein